ncbi:MAG: hypothetical protein KTR19_01635 [Hyphomicrobiales bacterium]|nr:hypothetical protein [Hyphomicrobiales bacterium]
MTAEDLGRFALIIVLGVFAFVVFLFAGTLVGVMWLEASRCNCIHLPAGLYVLGLLGVLFLASLIAEALDIQPIFEDLVANQRQALIIATIFFFVIILILI